MSQSIILAIKLSLLTSHWDDKLRKANYIPLLYKGNPNTDEWQEFIRMHTPNILLIEATFADYQGFEFSRLARLTYPPLRCIVSMPSSAQYYTKAIQIDVNGYLPEAITDVNELVRCLDHVNQGYRYISHAFQLALSFLPDEKKQIISNLSLRRKQILKLIAKGYTARQIAHELAIAEPTVRHHKEQITELLGLQGVYQLKIFVGSIAHLLD